MPCLHFDDDVLTGTSRLLSPFPDVRANASWFGADLICNASRQRQVLYSQVRPLVSCSGS
jgi:hypothetical protein